MSIAMVIFICCAYVAAHEVRRAWDELKRAEEAYDRARGKP